MVLGGCRSFLLLVTTGPTLFNDLHTIAQGIEKISLSKSNIFSGFGVKNERPEVQLTFLWNIRWPQN